MTVPKKKVSPYAKLTHERDTLRTFVREMAEGDCAYGDGCPKFGSRHGRCVSCRARTALEDAQSECDDEDNSNPEFDSDPDDW